jgi:hypothetical protein
VACRPLIYDRGRGWQHVALVARHFDQHASSQWQMVNKTLTQQQIAPERGGGREGHPNDPDEVDSDPDTAAARRLAEALDPSVIDSLLADAKAAGTPIDGVDGLLNQMTRRCSNGRCRPR